MRDGTAKVFVGVAGNFVRAMSDSDVTEAALRSCSLTVQVSTKLNRSHTVVGDTALILPTLGRSDRDVQATGEQFVTVEDSMSAVHATRGKLPPASPHLLSEVAIISRIAAATLAGREGAPAIDWAAYERDYGLIRDHIAAVVPGFHAFNERIKEPKGFTLPNPVNSGVYNTPTGKATFTGNHLEWLETPPGHLILQSLRSHDQWNTIPYAMDDRYRGIHNARRIVMVNPEDIAELGFADGDVVDIVSIWKDGVERRAPRFTLVAYPASRGSAAAYYPETNVLVPLDSVAEISNTPTSKGVLVRFERAAEPDRGED
jgi:anaerobic selenocysteine-containing dehydrogenase